ncbi:hypothetical protein [Anabaena subtropica]|uniref:Uncharacterized protein n=1 Tax=Anabaena subtropica FACHB-260 TaxID=2692884 RepID=A0ABR8CM05_9NOST|nr:hypothetical protein [Anabaena subtropica]MBD2344215.1 hypothetical protein [Anabaena subtropica FACHB-260]
MNLLSHSAGIFFKISLSLTGFITCLTVTSTPVLAQAIIEDPISDFSSGEPAVFAGAAVYLTPGAYLSTIAAEAVAPKGTYFAGFNGAYTVTAFSYIDPITHAAYPSLTLHTGGLAPLPYDVGGSIRGTVVERLRYGNLTLDEFTSLVRAAVGNDGLE